MSWLIPIVKANVIMIPYSCNATPSIYVRIGSSWTVLGSKYTHTIIALCEQDTQIHDLSEFWNEPVGGETVECVRFKTPNSIILHYHMKLLWRECSLAAEPDEKWLNAYQADQLVIFYLHGLLLLNYRRDRELIEPNGLSIFWYLDHRLYGDI